MNDILLTSLISLMSDKIRTVTNYSSTLSVCVCVGLWLGGCGWVQMGVGVGVSAHACIHVHNEQKEGQHFWMANKLNTIKLPHQHGYGIKIRLRNSKNKKCQP